MTGDQQPTSATAISKAGTPPTTPLPWDEAVRRLTEAEVYWLATVTPDGRPHVRPILAVWVEGALHTTSNPEAAKARNLSANDHCSISTSVDEVDVVYEGTATKVADDAHLQRVADAYQEKYGWPPVVVDGAFDAPYAAPTAGRPPYEVYEITPTLTYGFGTNEELVEVDPLAVLTAVSRVARRGR